MFNFLHKKKSAESAKDRLQLVLVHDRTDLTSAQLEALKNELLSAISRYIEIDPDAVQIGLEWLAAGGQLSVSIEEDAVSLSSEKQEKNPYLQGELFMALKGILNETSAYRKYFATVDLKTLY